MLFVFFSIMSTIFFLFGIKIGYKAATEYYRKIAVSSTQILLEAFHDQYKFTPETMDQIMINVENKMKLQKMLPKDHVFKNWFSNVIF